MEDRCCEFGSAAAYLITKYRCSSISDLRLRHSTSLVAATEAAVVVISIGQYNVVILSNNTLVICEPELDNSWSLFPLI